MREYPLQYASTDKNKKNRTIIGFVNYMPTKVSTAILQISKDISDNINVCKSF